LYERRRAEGILEVGRSDLESAKEDGEQAARKERRKLETYPFILRISLRRSTM